MPSKTIVAIVAITAILITCIIKNIDGALIASCVAIISGLGGYVAGKLKK